MIISQTEQWESMPINHYINSNFLHKVRSRCSCKEMCFIAAMYCNNLELSYI